MHNAKIRWKRASAGSLARRVVLISIALLAFPLLLHTLFLYREEYQQKIEDIQLTVRVIGEAQKALLEERMELLWNLLDAVGEDYGNFARELRIAEIPLPSKAKAHFAYIDPRQEVLFVGKEMPQQRALVITTPLVQLMHQLTHFEESPFPVFLALLGQDGKILAGEQKGNAITENIPIQGAQFSLLLTVPKTQLKNIHRSETLFRFFSLIFLIVILGGGLVWFLMRRMARPLRALSIAMQRISEGALHVRYVPDRMGFEINDLGRGFNQTLDALEHHQQEAERERIARERIAQELKIGHEIQRGLLPTHFPEIKNLDIAPGFLPAKEVAGDFYDLFLLENGSIFIAIADTAGKGISACLYALGFRSSLRTLAMENTNLSEIILHANDLFWLDVQNTGMFITLWAAIFDPKTRLLTYCCQGHTPAILKRGQEIQELTTSGIAMGAQKLDAVTTEQLELAPKDLLFLYTDGILEAQDPYGQMYGPKRLRDFLLRRKEISSEEIVERLLEDIHLYAQGAVQYDDMTLLAIRLLS